MVGIGPNHGLDLPVVEELVGIVAQMQAEGVEVGQMVKGGVETIVGARRDPVFGPTVMLTPDQQQKMRAAQAGARR